jgi:molybdopterin converting factor small subunit
VNVRIRLFAVARQLAGTEVISLELPAASTIAGLREALAAQVPALAAVLPHVLFAIGSQYAQDDSPLPAGGEVACIPPVSGG